MKRLALVLTSTLFINAFAQQRPPAPPAPSPQPTPTPQRQEQDDDVVRITTNLVQVDAVVTDRDGNQVTDLKAEDFEILENGRPQPITNFSYITTVAPNKTVAPAADKTAAKTPAPARGAAPTVAPARLRPDQVKRAIALVVDDLRMSAEGISSTRNALRKYVDEQLQPGDLVAIIRTSAGIGALQQFTSDRRQLHAAIDRVRFITRSGTRFGAFTAINTLDLLETQATTMPLEKTENVPQTEAQRLESEDVDRGGRGEGLREFRDTLFTVGTLGALNYVVRGLKDLPGRKAVVLFSDGISIFDSNSDKKERNERVVAALRQLIDHASRASVVFYPIDTRGLQPTGLTAVDDTSGSPAAPGGSGPSGSLSGISGMRPDTAQAVLSQRSAEMFEGQNGLNYLARETGGLALFNNNNLNRGIRRALDDISGYYLIGYRPEDATFDRATGARRYNTWTIKVKNRSNLRVRTRAGFLAVADAQSRGKAVTRSEQLMSALLSPFSAGGVNVQLTSFFINEAVTGSSVRSVIMMDARNLTFTPQPDGQQQAVLDIIAVTYGEDGQMVDQTNHIETIRARPATVKRFMREGVAYGLNVPIARPGAYQLRIAVRDAATGRVGSASQYIEVPKVGKERIALSSLVISGARPQADREFNADEVIKSVLGGRTSSASAARRVMAGGEGMVGVEDPQAGPGSRRFRQGMFLNYACIVYNARGDAAKPPQLTTQVRLFRDGQEVFTGAVLPLEIDGQTDMTRLTVAKSLQLGTVLTPGDYILHLTVTDTLASGDKRMTAGSIDFKIDD